MRQTTRKLQETSWLAQAIADKMDSEFNRNGSSARWSCLQTLKSLVNAADSGNSGIYYHRDEDNCSRQLIITTIPAGLQNALLGLAERYKDDDGNYIVQVRVTHGLNSAVITDISLLIDAMREGQI